MGLRFDLSNIPNWENTCYDRIYRAENPDEFEEAKNQKANVMGSAWSLSHDQTHVIRITPETDALVWMTMGLDLGEITEKNMVEWVFRWHFSSRLSGRPYGFQKVDDLISALKANMGLSVNVCTTTRKKFIRKELDRYVPRMEQSATDYLANHGKKKEVA
tara:strand:+ start:931 stop:1410 length:480 start_codon:yes stop_codon:yes gene_type:complete